MGEGRKEVGEGGKEMGEGGKEMGEDIKWVYLPTGYRLQYSTIHLRMESSK